MASGIFAILDDIAMLADDVAISTKIATQKTAAILGDDLAVSAEKASGFSQNRELQVIWAISKGSLLNKIIILPISFLLSYFLPWIISYILIVGGLYLLYEGAEKIEEYFHNHNQKNTHVLLESTKNNILDIEKDKIKSAIRTDFILSIEIIILALESVLDKTLFVRIITTSAVAIIATVGVYGFVALIVRLDNVGFWLINKNFVRSGNFLVSLMPRIIKALSYIGTIAMLLVGGGILSHNVSFIHHLTIISIPAMINNFAIGLIIGFIILFSINTLKKIKYRIKF